MSAIIYTTPESAPVGTLAHLQSWQSVVSMLAIERRDELGAAAEQLPYESMSRARLELLLHAIDKAIEAQDAFRAECAAAAR
ncbi:hypothetical protein [Tessaracoccus sp. Z1128]